MEPAMNDLGQPIGFALPDWVPPPVPPRAPMEGRYCRLEPLDAERHASALFAGYAANVDGRSWTYLPYGPFSDFDSFRDWLSAHCIGDDPLFFAIIDAADGTPVGVASYLRTSPAAGTIEVGHIHYTARLQRNRAATDAMYLMMRQVFELGYRRYEWKCDALNAISRTGAERLGFSFEGIFRQASIYKARNRDTAWYSIIDGEWPEIRRAIEAWLDPCNFDKSGRQCTRLSDLTRPLLKPSE
jgi:RimJ/RimL family protein N-acetyltransferase